MEIYEGHNAVMRKSLDQFGKFDISQDEFLLHFGNEKVNPSWVHLFSKGLAEINTYCSFAFRKHWIKKKSSSKSSNFFFKANAYCTFSTCNVLAFLDIKDEGLSNTNVTINVKFEGSICHIASERHARRLSLSVRKDTQTYFQQTRIPPSKEYIGRLMKLTPGQFATGNRDNVGCNPSALRKISSEARLALQEDENLVSSLLILKQIFELDEAKLVKEEFNQKPAVCGYIQCIQASPFAVICFNDAAVRLYHEVAKRNPIFCDATGTIVSVRNEAGNKLVTYYYSLVIKHPIRGKPPIAVAELISTDHTVLTVCYFINCFRRAEGLIFGFNNLISPKHIVIDRSMVLLLSFLQAFNMETLHEYLQRTFRVCSGAGSDKDIKKISPHACTSHVMNSAKKDCKKW